MKNTFKNNYRIIKTNNIIYIIKFLTNLMYKVNR